MDTHPHATTHSGIVRDQHFLTDDAVLDDLIAAAGILPTDHVLEIGAGRGSITRRLAETGSLVHAYEIDDVFKEELDCLAKTHDNLVLHYRNALTAPWRGCTKMVANIPFSIAEPVLHKAIKSGISTMALIVSDGFKDNLLSDETKIGILARLFYTVTPVRPIGRSSFTPAPRTDCWIVSFKARGPDSLAGSFTDEVLRTTIIGEGKTKNALRRALVLTGKTKNEAREIIAGLGLDEASLEKNVRLLTWRFFARLRTCLDVMGKK